jgi:thiamine-monophosphate kinase
MIDISDGLAPEVRHICKESKCGAIIYKDNIPIKDEVRKFAKMLCEDEYNYALYGGEDFELLFTASEENLSKVSGYLIGEITRGRKVKIISNGKEKELAGKGYDHFSNT